MEAYHYERPGEERFGFGVAAGAMPKGAERLRFGGAWWSVFRYSGGRVEPCTLRGRALARCD